MKNCFCPLVYLVCGIALSPETCFGRLGETEAELERRYGRPFYQSTKREDVPPGGEKTLSYLKDKIVIHVTLLRGRSASEGFEFKDANGRPIPIDGDVIEKAEAILDANSNGRVWRRLPAPQMVNKAFLHGWERDDDEAAAVVWRNDPNILEVSTSEFQQETGRARRAAAAGASGF
jgi:hypothetical protein